MTNADATCANEEFGQTPSLYHAPAAFQLNALLFGLRLNKRLMSRCSKVLLFSFLAMLHQFRLQSCDGRLATVMQV